MRIFAALLLGLAGCPASDKTDTGSGETGEAVTDSDLDTISDADEGSDRDSDGDGTPDFLDSDSDNDGLSDAQEAGDDDPSTAPVDSDGDGGPDYRDQDSDNNGVPDSEESGADLDGDGDLDRVDVDDDDDGISDEEEGSGSGTDSDGDGIPDRSDEDSDGDGIGDLYEAGDGETPVDTDGDGIADYLENDSDGDGISDTVESGVSSAEEEPRDTDGDGVYDFQDSDSDDDDILDSDEESYGTDPYDPDSDGDGYSDGLELELESDPGDPDSMPEEVVVELEYGGSTEQIVSFTLENGQADVALILDTTASMTSTATALASEYETLVDALDDLGSDIQYGYATYDDYAYGSYGSASYFDTPFALRQQLTDDRRSVQAALLATAIHGGSDGPESGMEALYQAATGAGYDLGCDGTYDEVYDVQPFRASPSDPFGGAGGQNYDASDDSTGDLGGLGFRDSALPILVYATDNYLRDPDSDNAYLNGGPGGCPMDAGSADVVSAVESLGATLVAISTNSVVPEAQMEELAVATGSLGDTDGDGEKDDPLVYVWYSTDTSLVENIVSAVEESVAPVDIREITLEVEGDAWGFVSDVEPESYTVEDPVTGDVVDFTLTLTGAVEATSENQIFEITLNVMGDGSVLLDTRSLVIVVPANE